MKIRKKTESQLIIGCPENATNRNVEGQECGMLSHHQYPKC